MFAGVALIGVLASYLANFFLEPPQLIYVELRRDPCSFGNIDVRIYYDV